ncbi:MAG: hypothetical protein QMD05_00980 [Candidatus Brocadiaceae bacterium]|nr:hypothetical protein [Candidatus Brocadiaceae bacterium]
MKKVLRYIQKGVLRITPFLFWGGKGVKSTYVHNKKRHAERSHVQYDSQPWDKEKV